MQHDVIAVSAAAEWLTAAGTIGAVIVAVGLQAWISFQSARHRPRLTLSLDQHHFTTERQRNGKPIPYLRAAVSNERGRAAAQEVEVLVESVIEVSGGGVRRWLVNPALSWPNSLDQLPRMTITPGSTRYVDVGFWLAPGAAVKIGDGPTHHAAELTFILSVNPVPHSGRHLLTPARYEIVLAAAARNADASRWMLKLAFQEYRDDGDPAMPKNLSAELTSLAN
jgi:hypothetical protein